jgi:DNA-binding MarR family transcriptional regulator
MKAESMRFIEEQALRMLQDDVDPTTCRTRLRRPDLAAKLRVDATTVDRIIGRLESAQLLKRHPSNRRLGWDIEVFPQG